MATLKLWRCQNEACTEDPHGRLIFDFANETGICPKCGADPTKPECAELIVPRVCIHLLAPDPAGPIVTGKGRMRIACMPQATRPPERHTRSPQATTCPLCLASDIFETAKQKSMPVELNAVPLGTALVG